MFVKSGLDYLIVSSLPSTESKSIADVKSRILYRYFLDWDVSCDGTKEADALSRFSADIVVTGNLTADCDAVTRLRIAAAFSSFAS